MSPGMPNGAAPAQPPLAETGDGGEQQRAGLSPRHQRAATLLSRLAATARSFLLYDAANDAVHGFLSMLLSSFLSALQEEGVLEFHVRPYEIVYEGEPVYLNRDMERSLAFRLYRDGVRMLRIRSGFDWEELAKLLEVLSARFTAVHQREDDAVTLLWKAAFRTVDVVAVEAIVPDEGEPTCRGRSFRSHRRRRGSASPTRLPSGCAPSRLPPRSRRRRMRSCSASGRCSSPRRLGSGSPR
jgi:hypothetical protein